MQPMEVFLLMFNKVMGVFKNVKITKYIVMLMSFLAVSALLIVLSIVFSDAVLAYNVEYDGAVIAQIEDKKVFKNAKFLAEECIASDNAEEYINTPELLLTLTLPDRIDNCAQTAHALLENSSNLIKCVALSVDGEQVAFYKDHDSLQAILDKKLKEYDVSGFENESEFIQNVEITEVYCPSDKYTSETEIFKKIDSLIVKTTTKVTREVSVAYKSITKKDSKKFVGYYAIGQKGVNGINNNVESVVCINGREIKRTKLEQEVVKEPINEIIVIGTAASSGTSGMIFPLPGAKSNYPITAYFGAIDSVHATPHKGMDFSAPYGTNIFAAKGGRVIYAGHSSNGYGYHVIISHGNGVNTVYAHASKLLVKKGETVTQGQVIAKVGSTGWSTGNHLHFEITVNGRYVNPGSYI